MLQKRYRDFFFDLEREINMRGKPDKGIDALNNLAVRSQANHFRARNNVILEAAISCMLDQDDAYTVAERLRTEADQLTRYI